MVDAKNLAKIAPPAAILLLVLSVFLGIQNASLRSDNYTTLKKMELAEKKLLEARTESENALAERNGIQQDLKKLQTDYDAMKIEFQKVDTQWKAAVEEKTYMEEMLLNKNKTIDILKKSPSSSGSEQLVEQIQEKDEEIRKLDEQNKLLGEKLQRLYQTTQNKIGEINVAKIALEETISSARKKIDEEWTTVNLGTVSANGNESASQKAARTQSKNVGRVLALNEEQGFLVIDLGKVDNLKNETTLEIKRDNQVIASLSVLEVRDEMSACNIQNVKEGQKIRVNDPVFIL